MVAAKVTVFGGMIPATDDRLLPDSAATHSENVWLYSGALLGLPEMQELHTNAIPDVGKVYRIPADYARPSYVPGSIWMEFEDANTDVIRAPVFGDTFDRYYWVSAGLAPRYNTRARIALGNPAFLLGIPSPSTAPGVTSTGGTGTDVTRAYVTTWVSVYGEEGAPSPPTVDSGKQDDTWTITLPTPAAGDLGVDRNLDTVRIYRTITSTAGYATFFLVAELPITDTTYDDTLTDTVVSGNSQLESFDWTPPPADLEGFLMMPNGIVAGWRSNEIWFSEAYRPHAWPVVYVHTVEYPVVGLGIAGQTLVVCTKGFPVAASGSTPSSITASKLASYEPCTSRGSILSAPEGVYYASPNGLVLVASGQAVNITKDLVSRDRWAQLTGDTLFRSARMGTAYYGFGSVVPGIFEPTAFEVTAFAQEDFSGARNGVLIDPFNQRVAFNLLTSEEEIYGVQNDAWSGEVFVLKEDKVFYINQDDANAERQSYRWRSKVFQTPKPNNFGAMKIYFDHPDDSFVLNPVRNTALVQELAEDQYGLLRLYADNRHVMTREIRQSGEIVKPPSGFKANFWQFEIEARVRVIGCHLASSVKELASI